MYCMLFGVAGERGFPLAAEYGGRQGRGGEAGGDCP
jgi:hypothetical protein